MDLYVQFYGIPAEIIMACCIALIKKMNVEHRMKINTDPRQRGRYLCNPSEGVRCFAS